MGTDKKRFEGKLDSISPRLLSGEGAAADTDDFFLILALIFNDLKGLIFFGTNTDELYEQIALDEVSVHTGEMSGLRIQQYKLLSSLVREFFAFLKENADILRSPAFQRIKLSLTRSAQDKWNELQQLALEDKVSEKSTFAYSLLLIRNNIAFHYDQAGKILRQGFKAFFIDGEKADMNARAYYILGDAMRDTRFYYADAAVKKYIVLKAAEVKEGRQEDDKPMTFEEHQKQLNTMAMAMNLTIQALLRKYLELKKRGR